MPVPYVPSRPADSNRIPKRKLYLVATKGVWGKVAQDYRDHVIPLDNDIHAIIKSWKIVRAA